MYWERYITGNLKAVDDIKTAMTPNEAIKNLKFNFVYLTVDAFREAVDVATVALKKQIPYKPKEYEDKYYACNCGNILLMKWKHYPTKLTPKSEGLPYCLACGQAIDWSRE